MQGSGCEVLGCKVQGTKGGGRARGVYRSGLRAQGMEGWRNMNKGSRVRHRGLECGGRRPGNRV